MPVSSMMCEGRIYSPSSLHELWQVAEPHPCLPHAEREHDYFCPHSHHLLDVYLVLVRVHVALSYLSCVTLPTTFSTVLISQMKTLRHSELESLTPGCTGASCLSLWLQNSAVDHLATLPHLHETRRRIDCWALFW